MFEIEPEDLRELENIEPYIERGGQIFFALDEQEHVMACCMTAPREDGDWEIMKFAAKGMYTGTGAGSACLKACNALPFCFDGRSVRAGPPPPSRVFYCSARLPCRLHRPEKYQPRDRASPTVQPTAQP